TEPTLEYQSTPNEIYTKYVNQLNNFTIPQTQPYNTSSPPYTISPLLNPTYNTNPYNPQSLITYLHPNLTRHHFQFTRLTSNQMLRFRTSQRRNTQYL
ncbi:C47 family peptidase, partial [Staphylococcus epidermidis]|uniref:C47 family peptidase n=1 Tax=Staphylococcus epidermidis TaxID=1282 RepID=UPI0028CB9C96